MTLSWIQPCCEACWIDDNAEWLDTDDSHFQHLLNIKRPHVVRMEETKVEQCSFCGSPTFIGIYVRRDPMTVRFPAHKEEEVIDTKGKT